MIRFRLLGPLTAQRDDSPIALGGQQQRAVLAMLLLHANRVLQISTIVDGLWSDRVPERSVNTVQVYVSALRRALGPGSDEAPLITTHGRGYQLLVEEGALDLAEFLAGTAEARRLRQRRRVSDAALQLRHALDLWRGPALVEFGDLPFAHAEIPALEESRLAAQEDLLALEIEQGEPGAAVAELSALAAAHPMRERLHALLMEALYRCGRQGDALAAYQRARDVLAEELGVDPSPELRTLHHRILAHDDLPRTRSDHGGPHLLLHDGGGAPRLVPLDPALSPVTIGRRSANDVCLGWDSEVSREHASLQIGPRGWELVDEGTSRHGSFVDGERVEGRRELVDAQVLRFGSTVVVFRSSGAAASAVHAGSGVTSDGTVRSAAQLDPTERAALEALATGATVPDELRETLHRRFDVLAVPTDQRDAVLLARARGIRALPSPP